MDLGFRASGMRGTKVHGYLPMSKSTCAYQKLRDLSVEYENSPIMGCNMIQALEGVWHRSLTAGEPSSTITFEGSRPKASEYLQ